MNRSLGCWYRQGFKLIITPGGILLGLLLLSGCGLKHSKSSQEVVSVTIAPIQYFVDRLVGAEVKVDVMVPRGANPATYSPTPGQIRKLSGASLYVRVGYLGFEMAWMDRLIELNGSMKIINLSDELSLIRGDEADHGDHHHEGGIDPHIWMSPKEVLRFLPVLKEALISLNPQGADSLKIRYQKLVSDVQQRDQLLAQVTRGLSNRKFMIFHPALTYLARDYGLEQLSIELNGKEPSPVALKKLIDRAKGEAVPVIFIQEEFDKRNAQLVSQETGAHLMVINPLAYNWLESIDGIIHMLEVNLQ